MGFMALAEKFHEIDYEEMLQRVPSWMVTQWFAYYKVKAAETDSGQKSNKILNELKTRR